MYVCRNNVPVKAMVNQEAMSRAPMVTPRVIVELMRARRLRGDGKLEETTHCGLYAKRMKCVSKAKVIITVIIAGASLIDAFGHNDRTLKGVA